MPVSVEGRDASDPILPFEDSLVGPLAAPDAPPWRVLVVDDDEDVHVATELAMRDVVIEGRALAFRHARSANEALAMIAADDDIAAVLLDVVMDTPDAGLQVVRRIRQELGRVALRVILRTGQPGYAPEIETLRDFDINDYRTKTELTRVRLYSSLTAAIRAYSQLRDVMRQRDELAALNAALERARTAERAEAARRLAAEAELRETRENIDRCVEQRTHELSQAVSELDTFNRMVSHDLRGPLSGLAGLSGLIQRELDSAEPQTIRQWLAMMEKQTSRLADLVGEMLNLTRVSHGALQRSGVSLQAVAQEAVETLALTFGAERTECIVVGPLPTLWVDATLVRQALVNLLSNALKFTTGVAAPKVTLTAEQRGDEWLLSVRDNGAGFDPARAGGLFKPFTRLHGAQFEGSGIGLTIVKRVVERHGGRVWAEGRPGGGATFSFSLPAAR